MIRENMIYELAKPEDLQAVYNVVQHTIKTIYPKYYPMEVVDFFCQHHSEDAIAKDIKNGYVSALKIDGTIVATGCFVDNHITRVYVLPEHQKKGAELESEVPVCKSKSLLRIFLARVNSGYSIRRKKVGIYNSKLEVTNPKWNLQNQID